MRRVAHDADLVGDRERVVLVVRHQDRGHVLPLEDLAHFQAQALAQVDVEVGERLVEQQQLRPRRERARERDALLLAAGQLVRVAGGGAFHADDVEQLADAPRAPGGVQLPQAETDVLADGEVGKQRVVLEHHADTAALRGDDVAGTAHVFAVDGDAPGRDLLESGDAAQRRGLAAAARAEYAADPALLAGRARTRPARGGRCSRAGSLAISSNGAIAGRIIAANMEISSVITIVNKKHSRFKW